MDTIKGPFEPPTRAAEVKATWNEYETIILEGKPGPEKAVHVEKDEQGWVLGDTVRLDSRGQPWREFRRARGTRWGDVGWVLENNLVIGKVLGNIRVVRTENLTVSQTSSLPQIGNSVLERTTRLLLTEIETNRLLLLNQGVQPYVLDFFRNRTHDIVSLFLKSIPDAVRRVVDNGDFTFSQLRGMPYDPSYILGRDSPKQTVIYAILFQDMDGRDGIYIGKSINAGQRVTAHIRCLQNVNAPGGVYREGRKAKNYIFVKLLELTDVTLQHENLLLQIFEHVFVCLFSSWKEELFQDIDNLRASQQYITDTAAAMIFTGMIDRISASTGWNPSGFGRGLNWKTPLFDNCWQRGLWTVRQIMPSVETGPVRIHTTQPRTVWTENRPGRTPRSSVHATDGIGAMRLSWTGAPYAGTAVSIVAEIYTGKDKRHPIPFARLPEPGPFSDWDDMNQLGIRLEWVDENGNFHSKPKQVARSVLTGGTWKMASLPQRMRDRFTPAERAAYPHLLATYLQVRCFIDSLRSVQYTTDGELFSWLKSRNPLIIKELVYDHLAQTVTIQDQAALIRPPPTLRSFEDNTIELHDLYDKFCRDGLIIGDRPAGGLIELGPHIELLVCALCYEPAHPIGRPGRSAQLCQRYQKVTPRRRNERRLVVLVSLSAGRVSTRIPLTWSRKKG